MNKYGARKTLTVFLMFFLFVSYCYPPAGAEPSEQEQLKEKQAELDAIQGQLGEKRQEVNSAREVAKTAYEQLRSVERELALAESELFKVEDSLYQVETQQASNARALGELADRLDERKTAYVRRIRNVYMHGQMNYLDVLLGAKDFTDFTTRFQLLTRIVQNDIKVIEDIKDTRQRIDRQQAQLAAYEEEIRKLHEELAGKQAVVSVHRKERLEVFGAAETERLQAEREYKELMSISAQIKEMIQRLEADGQPIGKGTGSMIWPIRGPITSPFGWRIHPIFGDRRYHSGLDIGADYGAPIKAADEGVVISSGWLGGYGYTVMLDHGAGLVTLYAHNSELTVKAGDMAFKGQTIALAGSTGYATGPHCHFEVRLHGEVTNPLDYLP
jgi:murein DD-endopeptidase MepM/ murein hydrolase activator NlpD